MTFCYYNTMVTLLKNNVLTHMHVYLHIFHISLEKVAKEHYKQIKEDYENEVLKLQKLVDSAVDPVEFVAASGKKLV